MNNLLIPCGTVSLSDAHGNLAFLHNCSGIHHGIFCLSHRQRFSGQGRLIHHRLPADYDAVQRDQISHSHDNLILRPDLPHGNQYLLIPGFFPDLFHLKTHTPRKVIHGFFVGPLLQKLSDFQQKHDGARGFIIPAQQGNRDRRGVQNFHFQLPRSQSADPLCQVPDRLNRRIYRPHGTRQKQRSRRLYEDRLNQPVLIMHGQAPSRLFRHALGQAFDPIVERAETFQNFPAFSLVPYRQISGARIGLYFPDAGRLFHPCTEQIRLPAGHRSLRHMYPDPPFHFVFDLKFHDASFLTAARRLQVPPPLLRSFLCLLVCVCLCRFCCLCRSFLFSSGIDRLSLSQDIFRVFLYLCGGFKNALFRSQNCRRAVCVYFLGVLARQHLNSGCAKQHAARENRRFFPVNIYHSRYPPFPDPDTPLRPVRSE